MDYSGQSLVNSKAMLPSFWEIFKNSWKILWEKPSPFLLVLAILSLAAVLFDELGSVFLGPFSDLFTEAMQGRYSQEEFLKEFNRLLDLPGLKTKLVAGILVPWLFGPISGLTLARVVLNQWDGYQVGISDIIYAISNYIVALYITILASLLFMVMFFLVFLAGLPMGLIQNLALGAGLPGPMFAFMTFFGFAVSLFIFIKFVWPVIRRFFFLNNLAFFILVDGHSGHWIGRLTEIFRRLKAFPGHINQAILVYIGLYIFLFFALSIVSLFLTVFGLPTWLASLISQIFFLIGAAWITLALSGFYRLCLYPEPDYAAVQLKEPAVNLRKD
ncbi:MAG: hypothetical protein LBS44_06600 [Deltaproteobacteria bacterium]|jgi:MFS family permease|nr:hypothetical protein [Deltaproteobacteria bacterium]